MKRNILFLITIAIILLVLLFWLKKTPLRPVEETFINFDTFVRLKFYPEKGMDTERIVERVSQELDRIDSLYGYRECSFTNVIKMNKDGMKITEEEQFILEKSNYVSEITEGSFDITIGFLEEIWGFREGDPHLPEKEEINAALSSIGNECIILTDSTVSLKKDKMIIDLGGISKGYAVDRAVEILKEEGIKAGIVDAGGDLKVFGKKPDEKEWVIGIRDPERNGKIIRKFLIDEGAVATSGNYERYFIEGGIRYHHILNPKTGYPADNCISVTILAKEAILSDALSTGIFVMGPERGMALIEKLTDVEAIMMYKEKGHLKIITSKGVKLK